MTTDRELLEEMVDHMSTRVQQNVKVVTPEDVGQSYFLHISRDTGIKKFIPMLSLRGGANENRDVTRVYVAPTVLGCFIGYGLAAEEFGMKTSNGNKEENGYKGGWMIYALPFKAALCPNIKMVVDQKSSDEHWMVTYSPETVEFIPEVAGRVFYSTILLTGKSKSSVSVWVTMFVEVAKEGGIPFSKNQYLEKGYWRIEGPEQQHARDWKDDKEYRVYPVSKGEYQAAKAESAALLGYKELANPPAYSKW